MAEQIVIFDDETGEIKDLPIGTTIRTPEQNDFWNRNKEAIQKASAAEKDYGWFVFLIYEPQKHIEEILGFKDDDKNVESMITRLIFMSTYLCKKGYLAKDNGDSITKKICEDMLGISHNRFLEFWNKMSELNIFQYNIKEDRIYLNPTLFNKGGSKSIRTGKVDAIRIKCESVRSLYNSCTNVTKHKNLGLIFKSLSCLNVRWNVICENIYETDKRLITPITLGDYCENVLGYDRSQAKRVAKSMQDATFHIEGEGDEHAFMYVVDANFKPESAFMIINPKLVYRGKDYHEVEELGYFKNRSPLIDNKQ